MTAYAQASVLYLWYTYYSRILTPGSAVSADKWAVLLTECMLTARVLDRVFAIDSTAFVSLQAIQKVTSPQKRKPEDFHLTAFTALTTALARGCAHMECLDIGKARHTAFEGTAIVLQEVWLFDVLTAEAFTKDTHLFSASVIPFTLCNSQRACSGAIQNICMLAVCYASSFWLPSQPWQGPGMVTLSDSINTCLYVIRQSLPRTTCACSNAEFLVLPLWLLMLRKFAMQGKVCLLAPLTSANGAQRCNCKCRDLWPDMQVKP